MNINRLVPSLIVGLVLLSLATIVSAGKPEGKGGGGKAEEVPSEANLFSFNSDQCGVGACYALGGDGGDQGVSLYKHATLEHPDGSNDCALVIATRIDKVSGKGFLWVPHPRPDDNCGGDMNRTFRIWQPEFNSPWPMNPRIDFNGMGFPDPVEEVEEVFAKIELAGLYRPVEDAELDGANVNIAIGPYRIAYLSPAMIVVDENPDIRTVTQDDGLASICKWQKVGKKLRQDACVPIDQDADGVPDDIRLPFKVIFHRDPP